MTNRNEQPPTASASQNDGIKVKEYNPIYADHEDHGRLLSLIEKVWLDETAWQKLAEQKLKIDRSTFRWMKEDLEESGCVASVAGRYAAILIRYPVAHFNKPEEERPLFVQIARPNHSVKSTM